MVELLADRKALLGHIEDVCPGFCGLGMLLTLYFTNLIEMSERHADYI